MQAFSSTSHPQCWTGQSQSCPFEWNSSPDEVWQWPLHADLQTNMACELPYQAVSHGLTHTPFIGSPYAFPAQHYLPNPVCLGPAVFGTGACLRAHGIQPLYASANNMEATLLGMQQFTLPHGIIGEAFAPPLEKQRRRRKRKNRKPRLRKRPLLGDEDTLRERELRSGGVVGPLSVTQRDIGWKSVLYDERRRSFVSICKDGFPAHLLTEWWDLCLERIYWDRGAKQERVLERSSAWLTTDGCQCRYVYSEMCWLPVEMPPWLKNLTETVCQKCGIVDRPNSCNLNLYNDGSEFIGWHYDDEPLLDSVKNDALIISLSLGASRWFELRAADDPEGLHEKVLLESGDICTMEGLCQKHYRHCVHREPEVDKPRINITWRWVVRHEEQCPLFAGDYRDSSSDEQSERSQCDVGTSAFETQTFSFQ